MCDNTAMLYGFLFIVFLFLLSFGLAVLWHYAILGFRNRNTPPPEPVEKPVYYIVEKKSRKSKPTYGEPKKIHME